MDICLLLLWFCMVLLLLMLLLLVCVLLLPLSFVLCLMVHLAGGDSPPNGLCHARGETALTLIIAFCLEGCWHRYWINLDHLCTQLHILV